MLNRTLQKQMFQTACLLAGLAVILGAFASHSLKEKIEASNLSTFEIGVRYQFYHALAILFLAVFLRRLQENVVRTVFWLWLAGIVVFSGSLYLLATRSLILGDDLKWIGGITPLGGIAFIAGWGWLAYKGYKMTSTREEAHSHRRKRTDKKISDTTTQA